MRRRFRRRKRFPLYNGFLLIFILFLFLLILIQRIRIDHLLEDADDSRLPDSQLEVAVMAQEENQEAVSQTRDKEEGEQTEEQQTADQEGEQTEGQQTGDKEEGEQTEGQQTGDKEEGEQTEEQEDLEEKVASVAAREIGSGAKKETICAQCVLARTSLYDAKKNGGNEPEGMDRTSMQELWGDNWEKTLQLFEECAEETRGEVLTYAGNYIYAAYHAVSAGTTRTMSQLYPETDMPYLREISCPKDASAEGYLAVLYWEKTEFFEKCGQLTENTEITDISQIQVMERDSADYVLSVQVGSDTYTGEAFRNAFSLNSACFTITDLGNNVRIVTKGIGHGFGMSQNTANVMATDGKSHQEILAAFFPNTVLEQLE